MGIGSLDVLLYPVKDITKAKAQFNALLGSEPVIDQSYYVQYKVGSLTVGLDPHGHAKGMTGPVGYWVVDDLQASIKQLLDAGATLHKGAANVGGGKTIASVIDADGTMIGLAELP